MYSVTNDKGFVRQSDKFGDREMVGEDIGSYKIVNSGEFAYNPARINVGSIARYGENSPCMISSLYVCFNHREGINSDWLLFLLKSKRINFYYDVYGEGGVRIYLFYPNFSRIKISVPEYKEQSKIGEFIFKIGEHIDNEIASMLRHQQQKTFFLKQMFI
jgi:type I restriction enzyme S subunit